MKELTDNQLTRQDFVDNSIFELFQLLNPSEKEIEWNIEMISDVRESIKEWMVDRLKLTHEISFYPYVEE